MKKIKFLIIVFFVVASVVIYRNFDKTGASHDKGDDKKVEKVSASPVKLKRAPVVNKAIVKATTSTNANEKKVNLGGLNLLRMDMKKLLPKLAEWTGKVIIPDASLDKVFLTIYSSEKHTREQILKHIYSSLELKGFVIEEHEDQIFIKKVSDAKLGVIPTLASDFPLEMIKDKTKRVQKVFKLKVYSPQRMKGLLSEMAWSKDIKMISDESTKTLIVIETVFSLLGIENVIRELDVPESDNTVSETIILRQGDAVTIAKILEILLKNESGNKGGRDYGRSSLGTPSSSVNFIGPSLNQIVLLPLPSQHGIIVRANTEDMKVIREWIEKLDLNDSGESEQEMVAVQYLDVVELASRLNTGFKSKLGIKSEVLIQPMEKAQKILIFGSTRNRNRIKDFILEMDVPSEKHVMKKFDLEYADPDQIKEYIEDLFPQQSNQQSYRYSYGRSNEPKKEDIVRVISNPVLKQVTVIAVPGNVAKISEQIKDWDQPLDLEEVMPQIITLKNSDPVKMKDLLTKLFSDEESSGSNSYWGMLYGGGQSKEKIVGALYGQLTFEAVADTKKIIIISKIPEAYTVIKDLIHKLDSEDIAELPMVIVLKYADAEALCDQLNALLNEQGTSATIRRSTRGLSSKAKIGGENDSEKQQSNNNDNKDSGGDSVIKPWWTTGRQSEGESPTSNLIGKIRFIPVHRSKAVLLLSPPEYKESLKKMIEELDQPGDQVLIKAVILQVDRKKLKSLGAKLSNNPLAFGNIGENMLTAISQLTTTKGIVTTGDVTRNTVSIQGDVNFLLDILQKEASAKILNQPSLWTMDNEEADFFKGDEIAIKVNDRVTDQNSVISEFTYRSVGVSLRVRPNITPENSVNLTVSLEISTVKPELVNGNIAIEQLKTSTHMSAADGETLMLGGILYQANNLINTKIPILSDIPLLGRLFTHKKREQFNNELLFFITPNVFKNKQDVQLNKEIKGALDLLEETKSEMKEKRQSLEKLFEKTK